MSKIGDKYQEKLAGARSIGDLQQIVRSYIADMTDPIQPAMSFAEAKFTLGEFYRATFPGRKSIFFGIEGKNIHKEAENAETVLQDETSP